MKTAQSPGESGAPAMVVTLPEEIDMASASASAAGLTAAVTAGDALVIADLTGTTFIDSHGARVLFFAHRDATAHGTELRFAIPHQAVQRIVRLLGYDQILRIYPTLEQARDSTLSGSGAG